MHINKKEILSLSIEERREFAFELLQSIDEEYIQTPQPDWKIKLIRERLNADIKEPDGADAWSEVKKKYLDK